MLNYTDITQNTYIQEKSVGFIGVDVLYAVHDVILVQCAYPTTRHRNAVTLACALQRTVALTSQDYRSAAAWKSKDNYDTSASVFVVQFNGFMSLTCDFDVTYSY